MLEEQLILRALFGGAIELEIPVRFEDVSDFRPVPNHQEVWTDASLDQSLILEIVEHQAASDNDCIDFYFKDLAEQNQAVSYQIENKQQPSIKPEAAYCHSQLVCAAPDEAPELLANALKAIITGHQKAAKGRQGHDAANNVQVQLAVFRFPDWHTDILISMNTPTHINAGSAAAQHTGSGPKTAHLSAPQLFKRILTTFSILDYSLFG